VEIMIVAAIIGLLAAIALPAFVKARKRTLITRTANDLKKFGDAFQMFAMDHGLYPEDSHNVLPDGMAEYINLANWNDCALGGQYNWEGPTWGKAGEYAYAGISLYETPASEAILRELDDLLDDGNLLTGSFRLTPNSRYTYIVEE
jgi:type IV pilus assembly protein PilA